MVINEHILISKLSFAVHGDATATSLSKLEEIFLSEAPLFAKGRPDNPSAKQIGEWMKGRPIGKPGHYRFFKYVVEKIVSNVGIYEQLSSDQKKVFRQIDRFLDKRIASFDDEQSDKLTSRNGNSMGLLEVKLIYDSLSESLVSMRDELAEERPNHPDGILSVEKSIEIIDLVEGHIARIDAVLVAQLSQDPRSDADVRDIVQQVGDEFRNWIMENKPEIVDVVMRLTPASAFIGLLSSAGANMAWATPIVLAMWGGKSVIGALKNIKS